METEKKNEEQKSEENSNTDLEFEEDTEHTTEDSKQIIAKLRERLKKAVEEKQEYLFGWQKAKADFINTRKKDEEANRQFAKFAKSDLVLELVSVLDSFDIAFANKGSWEKLPAEWRSGIERIHSQLMSVMSSNGLRELNPLGKVFDPTTEEAVSLVDTKNKDDDEKVLEVLQKGYLLHDKLIRPAKVRVGRYVLSRI